MIWPFREPAKPDVYEDKAPPVGMRVGNGTLFKASFHACITPSTADIGDLWVCDCGKKHYRRDGFWSERGP